MNGIEKYTDRAIELNNSGKKISEIEHQLKNEGANDIEIASAMKAIKIKFHREKSKIGLKKLAIAGLFLISGFIITCFNFHSNQSFTVVMYSFTSIGLVFLFWGLYDIIG